jgi:hypothetical protein
VPWLQDKYDNIEVGQKDVGTRQVSIVVKTKGKGGKPAPAPGAGEHPP